MGFKEFGVKDFEALTRQNLEMFDRAMRMFSPFGMPPAQSSAKQAAPPPAPSRDEEIRELKDQLAAMRQQIADLAQKK